MPRIIVYIFKDGIGYFSAVGQNERKKQSEREGVRQIFWSGGQTLKEAVDHAQKRAKRKKIKVPDLDLRVSP